MNKPVRALPGASVLAFVGLVAFAAACSEGSSPPNVGPTTGGASEGDTSGPDASTVADSGPTTESESPCTSGVTETCTAYDTRSYCVQSAGGTTWKTEKCAAGCFAGKCSTTACADECALGESGSRGRCQLWDMAQKSFVSATPATSLHDRARDYDRILRVTDLPHGQVMNAHYTDATRTQIAYYQGFGDAAIWTGSALAAQAWRLAATRSVDAEAQVKSLVQALHRSFVISGDPGYLARVVVPSAGGVTLSQSNRCSDPEWHCNVTYEGTSYDWLGATSRDQNTGVMLGYYAAYFATTDETVRKTIRGDVVAFVRELAKVRKAVPARVIVNDVPLDTTLDLENVVLVPSEMTNGRVQISLSTSNTGDSNIRGLREFFPDFAVVVKQVIGLNVPIKRPSSSTMIGAFFQMALRMSADDPAMAAVHKELSDYYGAHANGWLDIAEGWTFDGNCGRGYFANHIAYIMAYVYALLEKDANLSHRVVDNVLDGAMYKALRGHKNPYFTFLWGASRSSPDRAEIDGAIGQLSQFQPGPRVRVARDLQASPQYLPHDTQCTAEPLCDTKTLAVDVKDRVVDDFEWQRDPWSLVDSGDEALVYPGVDYLAAYWAARRYGFTNDDRAGTCARFGP